MFGEDIQSDRRISCVGSSVQFANKKTGNAVHKDMIFVTPEKFINPFVNTVGSSENTKPAFPIHLWWIIRIKFI